MATKEITTIGGGAWEALAHDTGHLGTDQQGLGNQKSWEKICGSVCIVAL